MRYLLRELWKTIGAFIAFFLFVFAVAAALQLTGGIAAGIVMALWLIATP